MGLRLLFTHKRYFSAFFGHHLGAKKRRADAEMVKKYNGWSGCFFGTPEIMMAGEDSRYIGVLQDFRTLRNIISPTVIPGHHQSLGASERHRRLYRTITDHVVGERKPKKI